MPCHEDICQQRITPRYETLFHRQAKSSRQTNKAKRPFYQEKKGSHLLPRQHLPIFLIILPYTNHRIPLILLHTYPPLARQLSHPTSISIPLLPSFTPSYPRPDQLTSQNTSSSFPAFPSVLLVLSFLVVLAFLDVGASTTKPLSES